MTTPLPILATSVLELPRSLRELPADLRLTSLEWTLLAAVSGRHTVLQVAAAFELEPERAVDVFRGLAERGLVAERPVFFPEHLRALGARGETTRRTLADFLRSGVTLGAPEAKGHGSGEPAGASAAGRGVSGGGAPAQSTPRGASSPPPPAFRPLAPPPDEAVPESPPDSAPDGPSAARRLGLRTLMRAILDRAEDRTAGQLDVYRVFIRVPTPLWRRNGVSSLQFEDDRLIEDAELHRELERSLEKTLGLGIPDEAWVSGTPETSEASEVPTPVEVS